MSYLDYFTSVNPLVGEKKVQNPVLTVFGVPYDGTTSYRPGTRFGPNSIREAFLNVEAYSRELDVDVERLALRDLGNLNRESSPESMIAAVSKVSGELFDAGEKFCMLGGEHSLTLGAIRSAPRDAALVVFDAHFDLRDEWEGSRYSHACYLRRATEVRDISTVAHVGGRAATKEEWSISEKLGLVISPSEADSASSIRSFSSFVERFGRVYVSVDIDCLDPAFAPGTGTPEPGGLTTRTLLKYIWSLRSVGIAAFDIMEVSPPYDNGSTVVAAARLMNELVALCGKQRNR